MTYRAPLTEMRFALEACAGFWSVRDRFPDLDEDVLGAILEGAAALAEETLAPLNQAGDRAGARLQPNGAVRTAPGFAAAYRLYAEGGWAGLAADPAYGGQGLPRALAFAAFETVHSANMGFGLCPMLNAGAIDALQHHGSLAQKQTYLPNLISGAWTGTMNLTEPQAGSDLGALTTKATPRADGSFGITGQKIYITWGEHDLTENIIHLVLARIEGAPAGSKGISLFVAPKVLPGSGARNALHCVGLEEKMGIHSSPTCTMAFENATGWLVGEENKGLAAMFTMMNAARINVGLQGVGIGEAAYQKARAHAHERKQGGGEIVKHPDVRRMLATMKAKVQVGRAICYATALAADAGDRPLEDLLTPIAKAWSTDMGVEVASLGVQIHGGAGFVEGDAAQHYRDARITPIYEGTNGIQAIDLYGRKVLGDRGDAMRRAIADVRRAAALLQHRGDAERLAVAAGALSEATDFMLSAERADGLAGASAFLTLAGDVIGAGLLAQGLTRAASLRFPPEFIREQAASFHVFAETALAQAPARLAAIKLGNAAFDAAF